MGTLSMYIVPCTVGFKLGFRLVCNHYHTAPYPDEPPGLHVGQNLYFGSLCWGFPSEPPLARGEPLGGSSLAARWSPASLGTVR